MARCARTWVWAVCFVAVLAPQGLSAQVADNRPLVVPGLSEIDDPLEPLVPRQPRTEEETDKIDSLALFAAARAAEDRDQRLEALRLYQRAFRRNPDAVAPLRQIVPLASSLDREDTALRYAIKLAELDDSDRNMAANLGAMLIEFGSEDAAAERLLEKAIQKAAASDSPGEQYLQRFRLARLQSRHAEYVKAAENLSQVEEALAKPAEHQLEGDALAELRQQTEGADEFFGETYLSAGNLDRARAAFQRAYPADDTANQSFRAAQIAIKANDDAEALRELERYFATGSAFRQALPYRLLVEVYTRQNRTAEIVPQLTKLWDVDQSEDVGIVLADQLVAASSWDKAIELFTELRAGDYALEAEQGLATAYHQANKPKELLDLLAARAASEPGIEILDKQVHAISEDDAMVDQLIAEARSRKESDENSLTFPAAFAMGLVAAEDKRAELAAEFYELAASLNPERKAQVYLAWGVGALLAEDYATSAKVFQRGIDEKALAEGNPLFHYHLSGSLEMLGETDKAVAAAHVVAENWQRLPTYATREPWILYHAKRYEESKAKYLELIEKLEGVQLSELEENYNRMAAREIYSDARQALRDSRLALSNIAVVQNQYAEAEEWLEQVLDEFPDDVGASNDLAYLWADQGKRLTRSLEMLRYAVSQAPDNLAYRDSLAWVLHRLGRNEEALPEIERAAAEMDADGVIFDHLGDIQQALGNTDAAQAAYEKAVAAFERDKETAEAERVRKKLVPK